MTLSKSDYMLYLRHPAWLWMKKHDKARLPPIDASLQALFDQGNLFEEYAEKLFPHAVRLGFQGYAEYLALPDLTKAAFKNGAETVLQGRIEAQGLTCIFDVLDKNEDGTYDLYEIKSSTGVKPEHEYDLAFQLVALEAAGFKIQNVKVICVNNTYVRNGEIDIQNLTLVTDVTEKVRGLTADTKTNIQKAFQVLASRTPPDMSPRHVKMNAMKDWLAIYKTIYPVDSQSIYHLCSITDAQVAELEDMGVTLIKDIPDTFVLTPKQRKQMEAVKLNQQLIDHENIDLFLQKIQYPLYFLDYETFASSIPPFNGIRPYQQVPFQYSLHILETPESELKHKEYLHRENSHSALPLVQRLRQDIGDTGTILVWYEPFEKGRNTDMGVMYPEYAEFMEGLNARVIDLMTPFSEGWFVDQGFMGSASIKKVLPVLVQELSYKNLTIQEGGSAQRIWTETVLNGLNAHEQEQIMKDLIEYCKLDTLAMVELFRVLRSKSSPV